MVSFIIDAVGTFIKGVQEIVWIIIQGIISMAKDIVGYFKGLMLKKNRDIPFIADANKPKFKEMLKNAPVCECGIFEGTYNEETDEIENTRFITSDEMDENTASQFDETGLVVLS